MITYREAKRILVYMSSEVLAHLALSLACSGDYWFELPKDVGRLGQLLQVEVAVHGLRLSLLLEVIEK
jgi:hypothetical protein